MKVVTFSRNIFYKDGVGNSAIHFNNFFSRFHETIMVSIDKDVNDVLGIDEYRKDHSKENILFYHFSIFDRNLDDILKLNFKYKIIYFHGITTPELLDNEFTKNECNKGIEQIKLLNNFDLYLFNSPQSKSQFLKNLNTNLEIRSLILPPLDLNDRFLINNHNLINLQKKEKYNAFYLGTLSSHKNISELLDFCERFKNQINLSIFTSDPNFLNNEFMQKYKLNNENLNLSFKYKCSDNDLLNYIKGMDFFITFSKHEGFCLPLFESIFLNKSLLVKELDTFKFFLPPDFKFLNNDYDFYDIENTILINSMNINITRDYVSEKLKNLILKFENVLKEFGII